MAKIISFEIPQKLWERLFDDAKLENISIPQAAINLMLQNQNKLDAVRADGYDEGFEAGKIWGLSQSTLYLHRNGERQWPEIEGAFWVEHFDGKFHAKEFFISEFNGKITCSDFQYLPSKARVYGPIPQPEIL